MNDVDEVKSKWWQAIIDFLGGGFGSILRFLKTVWEAEFESEPGKVNYRLMIVGAALFAMLFGLGGVDWIVRLIRPNSPSSSINVTQLALAYLVGSLLCVAMVTTYKILSERPPSED